MPQTLGEAHTDEDKVKAIIDHNFRGHQGEPEPPPPLQTLKGVKTPKDTLVLQLRYALSKTNNNSTPGDDKVLYKLLKLLQNTRLGTQVFKFLADFLRSKRTTFSGKENGRDMTVVMIPKPGKDLSTTKGWRPIVLMSCLLKLMDKVVAHELQHLDIFHPGQFESRKGKAAIDMAIQSTTEAQLSRKKGEQVAWALGDISFAFNYVQKETVLKKLESHEGLTRYIHWFFQSRQASITWDGEARGTRLVGAGVPQGSPLSSVVFAIAIAKVLEDTDKRLLREIPSHMITTYSYVDDFNCTAREKTGYRQRGRKPNTITATRKARTILSEELGANGWSRDLDKDEEIDFRVTGEAKWVGITFNYNLSWKTHCDRRLNLAEAAWACISRLGNSRGSLSPEAWRQVYTSSIRAIATYS